MVNVEEVRLPGVGVRYAFTSRFGKNLGVIAHRDGRREIFVYNDRDPDRCDATVLLSEEEAEAMADLLGGSSITRRLEGLHQEIEGLAIDWLRVEPGAASVGRTLAELRIRSRSGASVAAVLRAGGESLAAPGPDVRVEANDTAVVIGAPEAVKRAAAILLVG